MDTIYFKEVTLENKPKMLSTLLKQYYIDHGTPATFFTKDDSPQTHPKKRRSVSDLYAMICHYYPNTTLPRFARALKHFALKYNYEIHYCKTIKKYVLADRRTNPDMLQPDTFNIRKDSVNDGLYPAIPWNEEGLDGISAEKLYNWMSKTETRAKLDFIIT